MASSIDKLLALAGSPLAPPLPGSTAVRAPHGRELDAMLQERNGFYAFESALHVLPRGEATDGLSLENWNCEDLWRHEYGSLLAGHVFFAEDIFGCQFSLFVDGVYLFNPEVGSLSGLATSLEGWAARIMQDYEVLTGWPLAHAWQMKHGAIPVGKRLAPIYPFVLGGKYNTENLQVVDAVEGMQFRASIWRQIKELPNGAKVKLQVTE